MKTALVIFSCLISLQSFADDQPINELFRFEPGTVTILNPRFEYPKGVYNYIDYSWTDGVENLTATCKLFGFEDYTSSLSQAVEKDNAVSLYLRNNSVSFERYHGLLKPDAITSIVCKTSSPNQTSKFALTESWTDYSQKYLNSDGSTTVVLPAIKGRYFHESSKGSLVCKALGFKDYNDNSIMLSDRLLDESLRELLHVFRSKNIRLVLQTPNKSGKADNRFIEQISCYNPIQQAAK
jgi:hypothetical protein